MNTLRALLSKVTFAAYTALIIATIASAAELPVVSVTAKTVFIPNKKVSSHSVIARQQCLVGITNRSTSAALSQVRVSLLREGRNLFDLGPVDLASSQSVVLTHDMISGTSCSGNDVLFWVAFDQQGVHNEAILSPPVETALNLASTANWSQLPAAIFGLFSALIGAWIAHRFTMTREGQKDRLAWRTELFKTSEPAFRKFLLNWNLSLDHETLRRQFELLIDSVVVSSDIISTYERTHILLADKSVQQDAKKEAVNQFDRHLRDYVLGITPPMH